MIYLEAALWCAVCVLITAAYAVAVSWFGRAAAMATEYPKVEHSDR